MGEPTIKHMFTVVQHDTNVQKGTYGKPYVTKFMHNLRKVIYHINAVEEKMSELEDQLPPGKWDLKRVVNNVSLLINKSDGKGSAGIISNLSEFLSMLKAISSGISDLA